MNNAEATAIADKAASLARATGQTTNHHVVNSYRCRVTLTEIGAVVVIDAPGGTVTVVAR